MAHIILGAKGVDRRALRIRDHQLDLSVKGDTISRASLGFTAVTLVLLTPTQIQTTPTQKPTVFEIFGTRKGTAFRE